MQGLDSTYWIQAWSAHALCKKMVSNRIKGKIVLVGSFLGYSSFVGYTNYAPGKYALRGEWGVLGSYFYLILSRIAIATSYRVRFADVKATFPRSQNHAFSPCAAYPRPRRLAPLRNAPPRHLGPSLHAGRYQFAGVRNRTEIQTHPNEETRRGRSSPIARRRREAFVQRCVPNPSGTSCGVENVPIKLCRGRSLENPC